MTSIKKQIYYWSPHLVKIATPRAVINSAYSIQKYSNNFESTLINFFGEFSYYENELKQKKIKLRNFYNKNLINLFPKYGFLKSRFSFFVIFILSFIPLKNLLKKENPEYLVIHLLTSLPLFLLIIFKFNTKFILRISGKPRLHFIRKLFWKFTLKKIYKVTCPTLSTLNYIKSLKIVPNDKLILLYDPIFNISEFVKKKFNNKILNDNKLIFCAAGRLTHQKNFLFLCQCFEKLIKKNNNIKLNIAGEGEDKDKILMFIKTKKLQRNIFLLGHVDNIFQFFQKGQFFISSSLWEDPGFVLLEAAAARIPVISSNCETGPKELIIHNKNGILFESNYKESLIEKVNYALSLNKIEIKKLKYNNFISIKKFTLFAHFKIFNSILT